METARLSAESLLTILNDVLDFSKIEAGRMDLSPIEFSLRLSVHQTVKIFSVAAGEKKLALKVKVADDIPDRLVGDWDRVQQILINLIGNALKFTARGGVSVGVEQENSADGKLTAHFTVNDTGIGIVAEKQQVIFEAFRQADGSTTRRFGGTGLGLAICTKLVALMGGRIWVESEEGHGSTFQFTINLALSKAGEGQAFSTSASLENRLRATEASVEGARARLHILLAEDNAVNQRLGMKLLERRGHRVKLAGTGREALQCLEHDHFDVILMDVQMPDMDGLEATKAIRARERVSGGHIPIVALTAHTMKGDRERCLQAGMDAFITKPIDALAFLRAVEEAGTASAPVG
jgi:CheY-like chemotaxis protein